MKIKIAVNNNNNNNNKYMVLKNQVILKKPMFK